MRTTTALDRVATTKTMTTTDALTSSHGPATWILTVRPITSTPTMTTTASLMLPTLTPTTPASQRKCQPRPASTTHPDFGPSTNIVNTPAALITSTGSATASTLPERVLRASKHLVPRAPPPSPPSSTVTLTATVHPTSLTPTTTTTVRQTLRTPTTTTTVFLTWSTPMMTTTVSPTRASKLIPMATKPATTPVFRTVASQA